MEDAAGKMVDWLRTTMTTADGAPGFALVRLYKSHRFADIDDELQAFATAQAGGPVSADTRCLVLIATRGAEDAWNDRTASVGHRAIPLTSEAMVAQLPMVSALITQLGFEVSFVIEPPRSVGTRHHRAYDVFFVPEALGSKLVPAQAGFVVPYGIRSVVGFGGLLVSGDLFAIIGFATVPIAPEVATLFRTVAIAAKTALVPFTFDRI